MTDRGKQIASASPTPGEVMAFIQRHGEERAKGETVLDKEVFAAYFDILGFRERVGSDSSGLYQSYKDAVREFRDFVKPTGARHKQIEDRWELEIIGYTNMNPPVTFSDSTFFISTDTSARSFQEICHAANRFFLQMLAAGFPIRGAIATGAVYWDIEHGLYLGKAITTAYDFGEQMDVIGMVIHPAVVERLSSFGDEVAGPLEISFKEGRRLKLHVPRQGSGVSFSQNFGNPGEAWRKLAKAAVDGGSVSLIAKYENSEPVVEALLPSGTYLPK